jgi:hypothetical protein
MLYLLPPIQFSIKQDDDDDDADVDNIHLGRSYQMNGFFFILANKTEVGGLEEIQSGFFIMENEKKKFDIC